MERERGWREGSVGTRGFLWLEHGVAPSKMNDPSSLMDGLRRHAMDIQGPDRSVYAYTVQGATGGVEDVRCADHEERLLPSLSCPPLAQ